MTLDETTDAGVLAVVLGPDPWLSLEQAIENWGDNGLTQTAVAQYLCGFRDRNWAAVCDNADAVAALHSQIEESLGWRAGGPASDGNP